MTDTALVHYGIKGMKWGIRRTDAQLARARGQRKSDEPEKKTAPKKSESSLTRKSVKDMTDDELRSAISRLELERKYRDLTPTKQSAGKKFVTNVLKKSGENIATQFTTYVMGRAVNEAFKTVFKDEAIVNPKKGQKDK